MVAKDLISEVIPPLRTSDTGQAALNWMEIFRISHLPIVNNQDFLGLISDSDIYDMNQLSEPVGNHKLSAFNPFVNTDSHIFDVIGLAARMNLSVVPVLDKNNHYKGCVISAELINYMAGISGLASPGGIVVLEVLQHDYSLSQIAQIVESNNAKIISCYITSPTDSTTLEVTIKLNTMTITPVIRTFERYGYEVRSWLSEEDSLSDFYSDRFDNFIRFLDT